VKLDPGNRREAAPAVLARGSGRSGPTVQAGDAVARDNAYAVVEQVLGAMPRLAAPRPVERVIHARNAGAYGFFEAYGTAGDEPISVYTSARLFQRAGERTPLFTRFSTVAHGGHGPETVRDPRGFSIRFYLDEARWDFVGSSLPVSFVRDPTLFPSVAHAFRPEPVSHRLNPQRIFDFIRFTPSALNMVTWLFSPWGIPANYRTMCGFGAGIWINAGGSRTYVRYHFTPGDGARNLSQAEADALQARNFNHATQDLHEAIARGDAPEWEMAVQLIAEHDCDAFDFDPLDPTVAWPLDRVPRRAIGRIVLDRNPKNYFAEVEQVTFRPGALVDGLASADDSGSAARTRRSGRTRADELQQLMGMRAAPGATGSSLAAASRSRPAYPARAVEDGNHRHAGESYRRFNAAERDELVRNLVAALRECDEVVQAHMVEHLRACDADYGRRVAAGLGRLR
jgi:catalase